MRHSMTTYTDDSRKTSGNRSSARGIRLGIARCTLLCAMLFFAMADSLNGQERPSEHPNAGGAAAAGQPHDHNHDHNHDHGAVPAANENQAHKPITLPDDIRKNLREIVVQHGGRYKPLDTLARETTNSIWGSETVNGQHHLDFLLQCSFKQADMERTPLFSISNATFRDNIKLKASPSTDNRYSFHELVNHKPLMDHLQRIETDRSGKKPDDLDRKINDLKSKLLDFRDVTWGHKILLIPNPEQPHAAWQSTDWLVKSTDEGYANLKQAWMTFGGAFATTDLPKLREAADALILQLDSLPAKFRPPEAKMQQELHYNDFAPYNKAWKLMLLGVIIALAAIFVKKVWADVVTTIAMFAGFGILTYGIHLRWEIADRFPAANMFESLLFLSWGAALFTLVGPLLLRNRVVTLTSAVIAGISLMLADVLPLPSYYISPVSPVLLNTYWMALHVPVIMISYSILAIAVLVAHVQIIGEGILGKRWKYAEATDTMLYWYVISGSLLLIVGILTGSLWAASSWGRYWGWDPKEVWSLVAFLGYMAILHTRVSKETVPLPLKLLSMALIAAVFVVCIKTLNFADDKKSLMVAGGTFAGTAVAMVYFMLANSRFATAAKNIIAFWLIIMTYVGVNYVLGTGLHSYGFGVGNVASKTMLVGGIDLVILGICALLFYVRAYTDKEPNRQKNNE